MNIANGKDFVCRKDLFYMQERSFGVKNILLKKLTYIAVRRKFFKTRKIV